MLGQKLAPLAKIGQKSAGNVPKWFKIDLNCLRSISLKVRFQTCTIVWNAISTLKLIKYDGNWVDYKGVMGSKGVIGVSLLRMLSGVFLHVFSSLKMDLISSTCFSSKNGHFRALFALRSIWKWRQKFGSKILHYKDA